MGERNTSYIESPEVAARMAKGMEILNYFQGLYAGKALQSRNETGLIAETRRELSNLAKNIDDECEKTEGWEGLIVPEVYEQMKKYMELTGFQAKAYEKF